MHETETEAKNTEVKDYWKKFEEYVRSVYRDELDEEGIELALRSYLDYSYRTEKAPSLVKHFTVLIDFLRKEYEIDLEHDPELIFDFSLEWYRQKVKGEYIEVRYLIKAWEDATLEVTIMREYFHGGVVAFTPEEFNERIGRFLQTLRKRHEYIRITKIFIESIG